MKIFGRFLPQYVNVYVSSARLVVGLFTSGYRQKR